MRPVRTPAQTDAMRAALSRLETSDRLVVCADPNGSVSAQTWKGGFLAVFPLWHPRWVDRAPMPTDRNARMP